MSEKSFDLIFILDFHSLIDCSDEVFNTINFEINKTKILSTETKKLIKYYNETEDINEKIRLKKIIMKLKEALRNHKLEPIGGNNDENIDYRLFEVLGRDYFQKNIMLICNDNKRIRKFLPLIPVYKIFDKDLLVVSLNEKINEFKFNQEEKINEILSVRLQKEIAKADQKIANAKDEETNPGTIDDSKISPENIDAVDFAINETIEEEKKIEGQRVENEKQKLDEIFSEVGNHESEQIVKDAKATTIAGAKPVKIVEEKIIFDSQEKNDELVETVNNEIDTTTESTIKSKPAVADKIIEQNEENNSLDEDDEFGF